MRKSMAYLYGGIISENRALLTHDFRFIYVLGLHAENE